MIRINIELWPHGIEEYKVPLCEIDIANVGGGNRKESHHPECTRDYRVEIRRRWSGYFDQGEIDKDPKAVSCTVFGFLRNKFGVIELLKKALKDVEDIHGRRSKRLEKLGPVLEK